MFKFAHLLGRAPSASTEDDEDDKEKSKKARKAEDDKDKESAEEDEDEDGKDDDKKEGKKAKADDGDNDDDADAEDEDDEDQDEKKDVKKGRKAERDRCATIFASEHAAGRPALAASLAFNTSMPAKAAINVLAGAGLETSNGRQSLDARMQSVPNVKIGPDGSPEGKSASANAVAQQMTSLYNSAKGKK